ncbi:hypothetical protein N431DRAFT_417322 [Stipitochalara longipes BDJ]|nr:hypothetical protein N431DRAFT_417322 [Stipitochalara longipes BDJ]
MARGILHRIWRLGSRREKTIPGHRLDIEIAPLGSFSDTPQWRRVDTAVQIPSNDRNLISLSFAKQIGVVVFDDKGDIVDNIVELQWKRRDLTPGSIPYGCKAQFVIQADLPCEVIFGKHDPLEMLPGFPSPFEGANPQDFDQCYAFSKQRTNSWAKTTMIVRKSFSWGSDKSKAKSRKSSSDLRMSPKPPATNIFDQHELDRTEQIDNVSGSQAVQVGMALPNGAYNSAADGAGPTVIENRNMHSGAETGVTLATIPSNESAELREANLSLEDRISHFRGDILVPRQTTVSQKEDSQMTLGPNFGSEKTPTHTLAISKTPEIAPLKLCDNDHELQQSHLVWPEDNVVSFEPATSLRRSTSIPRVWVPFNIEDEKNDKKDAANGRAAHPDIVPGENDKSELLYPVASTSTPANAEKEKSRITSPIQNEDWAPSESNDSGVAFRKPDLRQNSLQSIEAKPIEPPRTVNLQPVARGSQEMTDPQSRADTSSELQHEDEPNQDITIRSAELSASQEAGNVLIREESQPSKQSEALAELGKKAPGDTQKDALDLVTDKNTSQLGPEESTRSLARSLNSHDPSAIIESRSQGEMTTPIVETNLLSRDNMLEGQSTNPEVKQHSERSSNSPKSRSKQRIKKRGKSPKIRNWKGDPSQKADLIPAPGADKFWDYDEELNAYYHIDSDTGSTFWYEDSSEESEE